jgi:hypothetical protein
MSDRNKDGDASLSPCLRSSLARPQPMSVSAEPHFTAPTAAVAAAVVLCRVFEFTARGGQQLSAFCRFLNHCAIFANFENTRNSFIIQFNFIVERCVWFSPSLTFRHEEQKIK